MNSTNHRLPKTPLLPWRYALFLALCALSVGLVFVMPWQVAVMSGFDAAALIFMLTLPPLYRNNAAGVRAHARENDANREVILLITSIVMLAILVTVATEMHQKQSLSAVYMILILATLVVAWLFSNLIYALHYAYLFYGGTDGGRDAAGIEFPGGNLPVYWDFTYFSFTLGMTFQTSDVEISSPRVRRVVLLHSVAAFIFNLGVIAFTINVLGSS